MTDRLPVGEPVEPGKPESRPGRGALRGQHVTLREIDPAGDAEALFAASHGRPGDEDLWTYLAYGPFASAAEMQTWLESCHASEDPLHLVVEARDRGPVGMVSFMRVVPVMRSLELGHIWYGTEVQRTKVNTESIYLMLCEAFDRLGYRRVEWKCDAFNARSRAAAERLGFTFEGIFRQHMIIKGRNRDTAWFAMLDDEWPRVKDAMERWLSGQAAGRSLRALYT